VLFLTILNFLFLAVLARKFLLIYIDYIPLLLYNVHMKILVDVNIFLAVILNEPEKKHIIELTNNFELISPEILPYELGNALSAMLKRNRLNKDQILTSYKIFEKIPVRLVSVEIEKALSIAAEYNIYAYDAYYLEAATRLNLGILTLDQKMRDIASELNISLMEGL
jgi:predicted nucleic acid-binding protein